MNSPAVDMLQPGVIGFGSDINQSTDTSQDTGFDAVFSGLLASAGIETAEQVDQADQVDDGENLEELEQPKQPAKTGSVNTAIPDNAVVIAQSPAASVSSEPQPVSAEAGTVEMVEQVNEPVKTPVQAPATYEEPIDDGVDLLPFNHRDSVMIVRPFQKVAGDMLAQWASDGKLTVNVEKTPSADTGVEFTQNGQMLAMRLTQQDHPVDESDPLGVSGRKIIDGPDFSVRGSVFRISPETKQGVENDIRMITELGDVITSPSRSGEMGQNSFSQDQAANDYVRKEAVPLELETDKGTPNHGFSAVLNSQGPSNAASDRPSEVIMNRPRLAEEIVDRIVSDVKLHIKDDNARITLRLDPPELGALRVEITSRDGIITANLRSASDVVRGLIETNLPTLKESLSQVGIKVDSFNVSSGLDFNQHAGRGSDQWNQPGTAYRNSRVETQVDPAVVLTAEGRAASNVNYSWFA